jgi:hypothetical protein
MQRNRSPQLDATEETDFLKSWPTRRWKIWGAGSTATSGLFENAADVGQKDRAEQKMVNPQ